MTCRTSNRRRDSKCYSIDVVCRTYEAPSLREAKCTTTHELLARAASPKGRHVLASMTGIDVARILEMVTTADLMRLSKIGPMYAAALRAAGVPTVCELKCRNPHRLQAAVWQAGANQKLFDFPPPLAFVRRWIEEAKLLEPIITYKIWHEIITYNEGERHGAA